MTLTDNPDAYAGLPVLFDLEEIPGGTRLTISQDRADFSDEQVAATIGGYNAFIDEIQNILTRIQAPDSRARRSECARPVQRSPRERGTGLGALDGRFTADRRRKKARSERVAGAGRVDDAGDALDRDLDPVGFRGRPHRISAALEDERPGDIGRQPPFAKRRASSSFANTTAGERASSSSPSSGAPS